MGLFCDEVDVYVNKLVRFPANSRFESVGTGWRGLGLGLLFQPPSTIVSSFKLQPLPFLSGPLRYAWLLCPSDDDIDAPQQ